MFICNSSVNEQYLDEVLLYTFFEKKSSLGLSLCMQFAIIFTILPQACNLIKKETLAQVFSCEFCKISNNTFFTEQL